MNIMSRLSREVKYFRGTFSMKFLMMQPGLHSPGRGSGTRFGNGSMIRYVPSWPSNLFNSIAAVPILVLYPLPISTTFLGLNALTTEYSALASCCINIHWLSADHSHFCLLRDRHSSSSTHSCFHASITFRKNQVKISTLKSIPAQRLAL